DRAGMIVGLDFEGDGETVANVYDAGILFSGPDEDLLRFGRKGLEHGPRVLIGAVLAPHDREDAQLGITGLPAQELLDALVLCGRKIVLLDQFGGDAGVGHRGKARRFTSYATATAAGASGAFSRACKASIMLSKMCRPSAQPRIGSLARSG